MTNNTIDLLTDMHFYRTNRACGDNLSASRKNLIHEVGIILV